MFMTGGMNIEVTRKINIRSGNGSNLHFVQLVEVRRRLA